MKKSNVVPAAVTPNVTTTANQIISAEIMTALESLKTAIANDSTFYRFAASSVLNFAENLSQANVSTCDDLLPLYTTAMSEQLVENAESFQQSWTANDLSAADFVIYETLLATNVAVADSFLASKRPAFKPVSTADKIKLVRSANNNIIARLENSYSVLLDCREFSPSLITEDMLTDIREKLELFRTSAKLILDRLK